MSTSRLVMVKNRTVAKTPSADREIWDLLEDDEINLADALRRQAEDPRLACDDSELGLR